MKKPMPQPCTEWAEKLVLTRSGGVSLVEQAALEQHLASCENCAAVFAEYRAMDEYLNRALNRKTLPSRRNVQPDNSSGLIDADTLAPLHTQFRIDGSHTTSRVQRWATSTRSIWIALPVIPLFLLFEILAHSLLKESLVEAMPGSLVATAATLALLAVVFAVRGSERRELVTRAHALKRESPLPRQVYRTAVLLRKTWKSWEVAAAGCSVLLILAACSQGALALSPASNGPVVPSYATGQVGLSEGSLVLDPLRRDGNLKISAAAALKNGNSSKERDFLRQAVSLDPSDAEAWIYLENARVLSTNRPYITLAVGTMLTSDFIGDGRDDLQGAFIMQEEYNEQMSNTGAPLLRLLIATTNDDEGSVVSVAQQIIQYARHDSTLLGVVGWPTSSTALAAVPILARAHIPMVSPTASSNYLTGISPYFFRIIGADEQQGDLGARFAIETLHVRHVVLFVDPRSNYSQSLAEAFERRFTASGYTVSKEIYTVGLPATVDTGLKAALLQKPDLIYFAGYDIDANELLLNLPPCLPSSCLKVMGGDGLSVFDDYTPKARLNLYRLYFTTFAFQDGWRTLSNLPKPKFFDEYAQTFQAGSLIGADAILSYDAVLAFLQADKIALSSAHTRPVTPDGLRQALTQITSQNFVEGASGPIAFGPNGNDSGKEVWVLSVDKNGQLYSLMQST